MTRSARRPAASADTRRGLAVRRLPLLLAAAATLLTGLAGGLVRIGWPLPAGWPEGLLATAVAAAVAHHGPLLLCGFFGTVIGVERAVALGRPWAWASPALAVAGAVLLLAGQAPAAAVVFAASAGLLAVATVTVLRRQREAFVVVLALAAAAGAVGSAAWAAGLPAARVLPWWLVFLVLTIAGERLELSRLVPPSPRARRAFAGVTVALLAAPVVAAFEPTAHARTAGEQALGLALLATAAWLARCDIARRTVRMAGATRWMAVALLAGYGWLGVAGALVAAGALAPGSPWRDAALHALLTGFVLSMVFAHALVILPAVLRLRVAWRPALAVPLALLHASVAVRVLAGLVDLPDGRRLAAAATVASLVMFAAVMSRGVRTARPAAGTPIAVPPVGPAPPPCLR